jgi:hypothetical protein
MGKLVERTDEDLQKEYRDYVRARRLSRPMHKDGDTAVMGMRPLLSLPYWIWIVLNKEESWGWVFETNANLEKFGRMYPEFLDINEKKAQKDADKWDSYEKAKMYLEKGLKDNTRASRFLSISKKD